MKPENIFQTYELFRQFVQNHEIPLWIICVPAILAGVIIRILSDITPLRKLITDTSDIRPSLALAFITNGPAVLYGIYTGDFLPATIMASISTGFAGRCLIQGIKTGL